MIVSYSDCRLADSSLRRHRNGKDEKSEEAAPI
jgi:hypothetical protein